MSDQSNTTASLSRRNALQGGLALAAASALPAIAQGTGPIRIGSTLALTGPLAQTGILHKIVGEIFLGQLNQAGGLLGRKVEWVLLDDQSKPEVTRTLYERLLTVDKVDLLIGPYATGSILSAMGVAQRYNKILVHHTFGIPSLAKYDMHFPAWPIGAFPEKTVTNRVVDMLGGKVKTVAVVTSKFPSVHFLALGARPVFKERGIDEVLFLEFEFGAKDFGPIAARVKDANPDLLFMGSIGLEGNQLLEALEKLNWTPKNHFYTYPTPGPLALSPLGKDALSFTAYEDLPPLNAAPGAGEFGKLFTEAAKANNIAYPYVETQTGASYSAWQVLTHAVKETKSLDDKKMSDYLKKNGAPTIIGKVRFDGPNNYGDDLMRIKQVQDQRWVLVYPDEFKTPGAKLIIK